MHLIFASKLFICFTILCFRFTKTHSKRDKLIARNFGAINILKLMTETPRKHIRNNIYLLCGASIIASIILIIIKVFTLEEQEILDIFGEETMMLVFTAIAFATKSGFIFKDK